ncbi:glycosyltransferase family 39 protein [Pseudomonas sp. R3.Fl]|uniref:ArnT family glycosyltransferase n=1 Tax=Pseudomonas sp. R3.Fl TaxID=2928708 RepID=UPI00201DDEFB|nr:glycosyltransferase family 39 protein [Pseudomonas sp. R3.Fl]MCL6690568.1 glycosyltransferase family 39 protein [Pseudomonas sp. R3.Fl]
MKSTSQKKQHSMIQRTLLSLQTQLQILKLLSLAILAFSCFIALYYADQLPLEAHAFRQTQTALTSYWFIKDGFQLAYETPVAGAPWSVPFEFPIYQIIVSVISKTLSLSLIGTGRIVSYAFLLLCIIPTWAICRTLKLPKTTIYIFTSLFLSSPIYLFWGRTFMIETTALFFSILAIYYFIKYLQTRSIENALIFSLIVSISALQKATTALPTLATLCAILLLIELQYSKNFSTLLSRRNILHLVILFAVPLIVCIAWTHYTDLIKLRSPMGQQLTSSALSKWNWGTIWQRFSSDLYVNVIWQRTLNGNLGGFLGLSVVLGGLSFTPPKAKLVIAASLALGLAPFLIFTNLHIIHDYYQTANTVFLIFSVSIALAYGLEEISKPSLISFILLFIITNNYLQYSGNYYQRTLATFGPETEDRLIASAIKGNTDSNESAVIFGKDWSSAISFLSQRKSLTVPEWLYEHEKVLKFPEKYLGTSKLGAIVVCPKTTKTTPAELMSWATEKGWKVSELSECYIALPEKRLPHTNQDAKFPSCIGSLDYARPTSPIISGGLYVGGWTMNDSMQHSIPDVVYITLTNESGVSTFNEAVQFPRPDVSDYYHRPDLGTVGFGLIMRYPTGAHEYKVGVARVTNGQLEICQFRKELRIENDEIRLIH